MMGRRLFRVGIMIYPVLMLLLRTLHCAPLFMMAKNESEMTKIKHRWAQNIVNLFDYEVEEVGEKPLSDETMVLIGNHIGFVDIPILMSAFPSVIFIAKKELRSWPIMGLCLALSGQILVDRKKGAGRKAMKHQIDQALRNVNGRSLVVFPSGTTTLKEDREWKKGIFDLAHSAQVSLCLFKIEYSHLRESAYIDDDNFIMKVREIFKLKNKKAKIIWLGRRETRADSQLLAQELRREVVEYGQ